MRWRVAAAASLAACSFNPGGPGAAGDGGVDTMSIDGSGPGDAAPPPDTGTPPPDATLPACATASAYSYSFGTHSYKIVTTPLSSLIAAADCALDGAHLAKVESQGENDFLDAIFNNDDSWLGANDAVAEGVFVWHDFSLVAGFSSWASGEPDNNLGLEDCVILIGNGKWEDVACGGGYRYACECDHP